MFLINSSRGQRIIRKAGKISANGQVSHGPTLLLETSGLDQGSGVMPALVYDNRRQ
jgi:hypothetical protein